MILHLIVLTSICQIVFYMVSDKMNLSYGKIILFLLILFGHFFIFPRFFYPDPSTNGINCGMPILGITLAFWIFGGGATILAHILYFYLGKSIPTIPEPVTVSSDNVFMDLMSYFCVKP